MQNGVCCIFALSVNLDILSCWLGLGEGSGWAMFFTTVMVVIILLIC